MSSTTSGERPKLNAMQREIYDVLAAYPEGLDIFQIRKVLGVTDSQEQLGRRLRSLRPFYIIKRRTEGRRHIYSLGPATGNLSPDKQISGKLRAEVLNTARGRCQQCGKTVADDGVRLQIDHKIPQTWGGLSTPENLWAICEECNHGKRDHFESYDASEMADLIGIESVHERIAHLLKMHLGKPVPSRLIEFVANATEQQDEWRKRLRELRYECIGLKIDVSRRKNAQGFAEVTYTLTNWRDLPPDHARLIREWEKRHRKKSSDGADDAAFSDS